MSFPRSLLLAVFASHFYLPTVQAWTWGQPNFDINAEQHMRTGPEQEPYFLQDEIYSIQMEAAQELNATEKKPVHVRIFGANGELKHEFDALMRHRGSSSLGFPKKQYALSIAGGGKQALLGMSKAEDYVLAAPYNDKSLMRDVLAYNLANLMGRFAPRTRLATGTLKIADGPEQKLGILVLTEKNEIGPGKVDIPKEVNGTSAFFLQIDRVKDGDRSITTDRGTQLIVDYPKSSKLTEAQENWLKSLFNELESSLDDSQSEGWRHIFDERIDLGSAVDFFIMQELGRNVDGYRLSSPLTIPAQGKVTFGPLWDFNLAFGNANYNNGSRIDGWRAEEDGVWFYRLIQHPVFCEQLKLRWVELRQQGALSNLTIFKVIDRETSIIQDHVDENFAIWGGLGQYLWPNAYWLPTFSEEQRALKSWVALRAQWMDQAIQNRICPVLQTEIPNSTP